MNIASDEVDAEAGEDDGADALPFALVLDDGMPRLKRQRCEPSASSGSFVPESDESDALAAAASAFQAARSAVPLVRKGPRSVQEAFRWPETKLDQVCKDPNREHRLRSLLEHGVLASSDFSGMGGDREIMRQLGLVMQARQWPLDAAARFRHVRACDIGRLQRTVLSYMSMNHDDFGSCVTGDLMERLPSTFLETISDMQPSEGDDVDTCVRKNSLIDSFIKENRAEIFAGSASYCYVHDNMCLTDRGLHLQDEQSQVPLRVNLAGTTCVGWSAVGSRKGFGHTSEVAHSVWLNERLHNAEALKEDMFIHECTMLYPAQEKLADPLSETHVVLSIKTGPQSQGFPSSRNRTLSAGLSKATTIWMGPTAPDLLQRDFDSIFATTMELSGNIFFLEDDETQRRCNIDKAVCQRGRNRLVLQSLNRWDLLQSCLAPGAATRLREYDEKRANRVDPEGAFLADVEHWPGQCLGSGGPLFPCQLKHGTVVSWQHQRAATGMEHLAAQGYHVFDVVGPKTPLYSLLSTLDDCKLKQLSGNGWSLPAVCAWMLYVWSNTCKRPPSSLLRFLACSRIRSGSDDDDVDDGQIGVGCSQPEPDAEACGLDAANEVPEQVNSSDSDADVHASLVTSLVYQEEDDFAPQT
ncbi:unnamed protein product [Symbiodinium sp. CCMP2456]|nr:unnamed protein product [Symbiodinium sp. CCMP2456]